MIIAVPSAYANAVLLMLYNKNKNDPVMAIGGFTGKAPILNLDELKKYIDDGKVRFFFIPAFLSSRNQEGNAEL